jgi:hypothetical protein
MVARVWRSAVPRHPWIQPASSMHPEGGARTYSKNIRRVHTERWHLFKVQSTVRHRSGGLAEPRRSGYHLSPLRGGETSTEDVFPNLNRNLPFFRATEGKAEIKIRITIKSGSQNPEGSQMVARVWRSAVPRHPWIQPASSMHPEGGARTYSENIWRVHTGRWHLFKVQTRRAMLIRRSRRASTLRLPSVTPSGWGNEHGGSLS